jgi:hypothetical protein
MKKKSLFLFAVVQASICLSQNPQLQYKSALKIYNLASLEKYTNSTDSNTDYSTLFTFNTRRLDIFHPTLAFQWNNKKKNTHEVELTRFSVNKVLNSTSSQAGNSAQSQTLSGADVLTVDISLRYEYILNLRKPKDKKMIPSLGFAINPYLNYISIQSLASTTFASSSWHLGARLFVVPRLNFHLSSRIFLDLNIPVCLVDDYQLRNANSSPNLSLENRITYSNFFEFLPKVYSVRFGVGFKF